MQYDRTVLAYHGCDEAVARRLLHAQERFRQSENDYDWLGRGIYFWEYGANRAFRFAKQQVRRRRIKKPAVIGALIQLGRCFDLMDTRFTEDLAAAYGVWATGLTKKGVSLPVNSGATPDRKLRRRDCAALNWYLDQLEEKGQGYDSVRCGFVEGSLVYEGSGIHRESHVQLAVRNPNCILGVFRPIMELK